MVPSEGMSYGGGVFLGRVLCFFMLAKFPSLWLSVKAVIGVTNFQGHCLAFRAFRRLELNLVAVALIVLPATNAVRGEARQDGEAQLNEGAFVSSERGDSVGGVAVGGGVHPGRLSVGQANIRATVCAGEDTRVGAAKDLAVGMFGGDTASGAATPGTLLLNAKGQHGAVVRGQGAVKPAFRQLAIGLGPAGALDAVGFGAGFPSLACSGIFGRLGCGMAAEMEHSAKQQYREKRWTHGLGMVPTPKTRPLGENCTESRFHGAT